MSDSAGGHFCHDCNRIILPDEIHMHEISQDSYAAAVKELDELKLWQEQTKHAGSNNIALLELNAKLTEQVEAFRAALEQIILDSEKYHITCNEYNEGFDPDGIARQVLAEWPKAAT